MLEMKYSRLLTILLVIIIIAIIGLLGYLGFSHYKNVSTKDEAEQWVATFSEQGEQTGQSQNVSDEGNISDEVLAADVGSGQSNTSNTYKGYEVVGSIEIPKTNVTYPVFKGPPTIKKLDLAVAVGYPSGSGLNVEGNVVIMGHNYRNGSFFSDNKKLSEGDKIYIEDLDKHKITYVIYKTFITTKDDTSFYNRDTEGAREITLSTCADDDTEQRVIVLAKEE